MTLKGRGESVAEVGIDGGGVEVCADGFGDAFEAKSRCRSKVKEEKRKGRENVEVDGDISSLRFFQTPRAHSDNPLSTLENPRQQQAHPLPLERNAVDFRG